MLAIPAVFAFSFAGERKKKVAARYLTKVPIHIESALQRIIRRRIELTRVTRGQIGDIRLENAEP